MPDLSLRLKTIAALVPDGARVCDVGTDHAYLPIFLKTSKKATNIIATDINVKPLKNAADNIKKHGITDIDLRLCDGLSAVKEDEVDTIVIAGMGGEVITQILENCIWIKSKNLNLILQPTTSAEILREYLVKNGFTLKSETPVFENRKLYSVMLVTFTDTFANFPDSYFYAGEIPPTDIGILYIQKQQNRIFKCMCALENIASKQSDFQKYQSIYAQLEKILTENSHGI